ncbi:MAG: hypothetical protein WBG46_14175 [Nonlabens sp.]
MKTILILITLKVGMLLGAQMENEYLKITIDGKTEINYPSSTSFELVDKNGYPLITSDMLESTYQLTEKGTLNLKVSWKEAPKSIPLKAGSVITYVTHNRSKKNHSYQSQIKKSSNTKLNNGISIQKKTFIKDKSGYYNNAIIEFSNGVTFKFMDNKVTFTQNGKELEYTNKYVVTTQNGILKLSYDPYNTETWFVFDSKK